MKKVAVLFLSMLFLLSGCMTISEGDVSAFLGVGDLTASAADQAGLDLSGITAVMEAARNGDARGVRVYFTAEDQIYAEAILTVDGAQAALCLRHASEAPESVYVTRDGDMVQALSQFMDGVAAEPVPALDEMTDEQIEAMVAEMEAALAEMDPDALAELESMSEEDWQAQLDGAAEKAAQIEELLARCIQPGGTQTIDGVDYDVTGINIGNDDLAEILNVLSDGENLGQALIDSGCEVTVTGTVYDAGDLGGLEFAVDALTPEGENVTVTFSADQMDQTDVQTVQAGVWVDGEQAAAFSMDVLAGAGDSADWMDIDLSDAVDLTGMDGEEASKLVGDDCADFIGAALSGVLGRLTSNRLMSALPW